ncbi:MAG: aminoacyl-tRNA hydrolase [Campylobacterales bacterium]|nr:aminoacyl-tRNA hydrolase [Campylobacterales bacterium]
MTLFVGLGNPGRTYENNRHNIGFRVIDALASALNAQDISKSTFFGTLFKSNDILLLKPTTYMNLSGKSVQAVANFYKIEMDDIIVIHDDIDIPFGALRFKKGGGDGGHNGLKSIDSLISKEYNRVRIGVGKPLHSHQTADYVLSDFTSDEEQKLKVLLPHIQEACLEFMKSSLETIRARFTLKQKEE